MSDEKIWRVEPLEFPIEESDEQESEEDELEE